MFGETEGEIVGGDKRKSPRDPAQSQAPGMSGNSMRENRETPLASGSSRPDRLEKATSYKTSMHVSGESDEQVVCAEQRVDREGSSPSGARMRSAVSESGGNSSLAGESGRYGDV